EAAEPLLLTAVRVTRTMYHEPLDQMRTGRFDRAPYKMMPTMLGSTGDGFIDRRYARACEAAYLRHSSAVVEIAKLPTEVQSERLKRLGAPAEKLPRLIEGLMRGTDWVK